MKKLVIWLKSLFGIQPVFSGGTDTTFSTLSADTSTYIAAKTLMIAERILRFYNIADKAVLPDNNSLTFQYTRFERLPLPTSSITDGTTPTSTALSVSVVTAVAVQWGNVVTISDVAEMSIKHKPLQKAIELLGKNAGETIEREIYNVVSAGTSVYYPGAVTSRAGLGAGDVTTADVVRKVVANLRQNGAWGLEPAKDDSDPELGDLYVAVCDPFVEADMSDDSDFKAAHVYQNTKVLWNEEIGTYLGVRWVRSNSLPTITAMAEINASDNSADNGTITAAFYVRTMVTGIDDTFGYESKLTVADNFQAANDANNAHTASLILPAVSGFTYFNIYASIMSASTTTAANTMYKVASRVVAGTYKVGSSVGTASASRFVLPTDTSGIASPAEVAASAKVHQTFFFGREAFTCVNLQNLTSTLTPSVESDSDPLKQRRKAGFKVMFKAVITNQNYMTRVESESAFD